MAIEPAVREMVGATGGAGGEPTGPGMTLGPEPGASAPDEGVYRILAELAARG